jgi:glycosyltransferase involved in cell wall biosynthesis
MPAGDESPTSRRTENLSVVVPVWNEQDMIPTMLAVARDALSDLVKAGEIAGYEIVCVDDASSDGTGALLDEVAAADDTVRVTPTCRSTSARRRDCCTWYAPIRPTC